MARSARSRSRRRRLHALRALPQTQLVFLALVTGVLCVLHMWDRFLFPLSTLVIVLMVGGFLMKTRPLTVLLLVVGSGLVAVSLRDPASLNQFFARYVGDWLVLATTAVLMLVFAHRRERRGLQGIMGEVMLIDLRDRLREQGQVPRLPPGWQVQSTLKPAYGDSFSGDFLVARLLEETSTLRLALVDVSGKGQAAGTRSLLLSGAFGGLIGARDVGFLTSANDYLLDRRWDEGFATAAHFRLDLHTGQFEISRAGHPPAVQYHRGSGSWEVLRGAVGPALGLLPDEEFPVERGSLEVGDALILYTDGVVERPGQDVDLGIDHLLGQAQLLAQDGFPPGGSDWLVEAASADAGDDRAVVLVIRQEGPPSTPQVAGRHGRLRAVVRRLLGEPPPDTSEEAVRPTPPARLS